VDQLGTWNGWERFCPKPFDATLTLTPDEEMGVALELPTHSSVRINMRERLKKVWRPSPYCGGSYGRWRDRSRGGHGRIVLLVFVGVVECARV
jgi:hypothetical protein